MPSIHDDILDAALQAIKDIATATNLDLHICSQEPTTYTEAVTTYSLGDKNDVAMGTIGAGTPSGRQVPVTAITDGDVTATGTASHWALVDTNTSRLIATESLSSSQAVTSGNTFTLAEFDIVLPDPA